MIDLEHLRDYTLPETPGFNPMGWAGDIRLYPETHRAQMAFVNQEGARFLHRLLVSAYIMTGDVWEPFAKGNFRDVETRKGLFPLAGKELADLKKWLYRKGISFDTEVFVVPNYNDYPVITTWKMVIHYAGTIFNGDDIAVFDRSTNWCLFYFHEGELFFGKNKCYDPAADEAMMQELNDRKQKFPRFRHPYL